jgi:CD109 antigen
LFLTEQQDVAGEGVGLTAQALIAFLSVPNVATKYSAVITKATDYILKKVENINHLYSLALAAYALQKAGHASVTNILKRLDKLATVENGLKWWEQPSSMYVNIEIKIEITSVILSTYLNTGSYIEMLPVVKWLIKQRNAQDRYTSALYTIYSIDALAKMASRLYVTDPDIDVNIRFGADGLYNVKVDRKNAIAVQNYELPLDTKHIKFQCKGIGFTIAQVAYKYYVLGPEPSPRYNIEISKLPMDFGLHLRICLSFIRYSYGKEAGVTVVEVAFPSGYTVSIGTIEKLRTLNNIFVIDKNN